MSDTIITTKPAVEQFRDAMAERGITPPEVIETDGKIHRFSTSGKPDDDAGWYVFHDGDIPIGSFGDFRTGDGASHWSAEIGRDLSPAERNDFQQKHENARTKRDEELAKRRQEAKDKAAGMWRAAKPASDTHPYLARKAVKSHGLRTWKDLLLVPLIDASGELQSLQLIDGDGDKKFLSGGKTQGCYHILGSIRPNEPILIAEGYATAATIYKATGLPTVIAFNAGNLLPVAKAIRAHYPDAPLIFCADDDIKTKGNPGVTKANEALQVVNGAGNGMVLIPEFGKYRPDGATDFNDMAALRGKEAVLYFFASRSLIRKDSLSKIDPTAQAMASVRATANSSENSPAYFSKPAFTAAPASDVPKHNVAAPNFKVSGDQVTTGIITDYGTAPYKFDGKNNQSFYVTVKSGDDSKTFWGIGLEKALAESGLGRNDEVAVINKGKMSLQVMSKRRGARGNIMGEEPKTVTKNIWQIKPLHDYLSSRRLMAKTYALQQKQLDQAAPKPSPKPSPDKSAPEVPEPSKAHFSVADFAALQALWKNVPRQSAFHAESGYHIQIDDKQHIHITQDRIALNLKSKDRPGAVYPDVAYTAACQHALHFWQGRMDIEGDRDHRIKAYAYAQAFGVTITNYIPCDDELIESEILLQELRQEMAPDSSRPSMRPQPAKPKLKTNPSADLTV